MLRLPHASPRSQHVRQPAGAARPAHTRRTARAGAFVLAGALVFAACSGGDDAASDTAGTSGSGGSPTTAIKTPSGNAASGSTATVAVTPQTQVQSQVIETPAEALTIPATNPALATDYKPSPDNESIVLEATVPTVHIYGSATSTASSSTLTNPLPSGAPLTFLVDGQTSTRYKVLLPIKPNGSTGWLDPAEVGVKKTHKYKVVVELKEHKIIVTNADKVILSEKIAVGKGATPTPNGRYYIKELLRPPNPDGAYGPYAYGLSGYSPVVQNFRGGDDTIGIHGTDEPQLLGQDVSHGCIRMSNAGITTLSKILPLGTPVIVKA